MGDMKRALLFPGQGSQAIGMGKELCGAFQAAKDVFQEVDDALNQKLSLLMFDGSDADLKLTENTQPALMAVSMAVVRVLEKQGGKKLTDLASYVAGHSLGEYAALCAVGTLSLRDTAKLLRIRGSAMQAAVPVGVGSMAALLGVTLNEALDIAKDAEQGQVCSVANDNSVGQVVISGHKEAIERAVAIAATKGFKRSVILQVSAPFHCALMKPAQEIMSQHLNNVKMNAPSVPVVTNVSAKAETDIHALRTHLEYQVSGMVRWRESMLYLKDKGVEAAIEAGSGTVLAGLMKRIDKDIQVTSLHTPQDIETFLKTVH